MAKLIFSKTMQPIQAIIKKIKNLRRSRDHNKSKETRVTK